LELFLSLAPSNFCTPFSMLFIFFFSLVMCCEVTSALYSNLL
jgi:hypothetical protein